MDNLNTPTQALIAAFEKADEIDAHKPEQGNGYRISRAVSAVAFWYEKLRTAMEYREEYLLRRSAIQRILARKLMVVGEPSVLLESLVKELIWARYIPVAPLSAENKDEALRVIILYLEVIKEIENATLKNWAISILASDLEKLLAKSFWLRQEALANYAYFFLSRQLEIVGDVDLSLTNVQLYIAVWRAYLHADDEVLSFILLKQRLGSIEERVQGIKDHGLELEKEIELDLSNPVSEKLQRFIERNLPPFLVLRDLLEEFPEEISGVLSDQKRLGEAINQVCERRYVTIHQRVRTAIVRSIVYILLTKMALVFVVEIPIDRWLYGGTSYLALIVNSLLPPLLMFIFSFTIQIPDKANTERIFSLLSKIVEGPPEALPRTIVSLGKASRRPTLSGVFSLLYGLAFLVSFGLIYYVLSLLGFRLISKMVFVFFVSVVSFFSYRIRRVANQYLFEEKENFFSPITDFFMVPILRVGRILSKGLAQINILLFIIDLTIEMPFKVIFDLTEEWSSYIRNKREEIV